MNKENQRKLRDHFRLARGEWRPLNWQEPQISIAERIAAIAAEAPHRLALFDYDVALTYSELDESANRIARAILAERGTGQEAVALLVGVNAHAACAALGVMKSGKFYVAIEESFPRERALYILEDAEAGLIVTDDGHYQAALDLAGEARQVINLDNLPAINAGPPDSATTLDSMALLIYTSGSTGRPKGVVISHRVAFAQTVRYQSNFRIATTDRYANFFALAWSSSLAMYGTLCLGGAVGNFDLRRYTSRQLSDWLLETRITFIIPLTIIRNLADLKPAAKFPAVRLVILATDAVYGRDVSASRDLFPQAEIAVVYGCSEAGAVSGSIVDWDELPDQELMPLGSPFPGIGMHLLTGEGRAAGAEEAGEIVLEDDFLAEGYWRRPELTAAKFQCGGVWGEGRAYFTGDVGRFTADGALQFVGRKDFMVKIRGYQVFTNEIDALLLAADGVKEGCVTLKNLPDGAQVLVAYLVVNDEVFPGAGALHAQLQELPPYMKPAIFEYLSAMPRTSTGKIDRGRLPSPTQSRLNVSAQYTAPRSPIEEILAGIWGSMFGIENVGVHDDFLELGGDSLKSIRIINQVNETLEVEFSIMEFFDALTIAEMAEIIQEHLQPGELAQGENKL